MTKDYYEILGLSKSATDDDIKKAYRKMAREHHPDMVKDSDKQGAERRFKEINEAYQVLGDAQKRKSYDQFGHAGAQYQNPNTSGFGGFGGFGGQNAGQWGPFTYTYASGGGQGMGSENIDPFDIFENFFGFRGFGQNVKSKRGKNLYYELTLSFEDAVRGSDKEITIESGKVKIKIPTGVRDGTELRFPQKGMPSADGSSHGDLFITLRVQTPKMFERDGDDIYTKVSVDFVDAILGGDVEVFEINPKEPNGVGKTKLKIPEGTQPGTVFKLRGKGMPRLQGRGTGDLFVRVVVEVPKKVSKRQKDLLETYRAS